MRRGLPNEASSGREARIRRAAPSARGKSSSGGSSPWWHQPLLWMLLLASLPLVSTALPLAGAPSLALWLPYALVAHGGTAMFAFLGLWLSYRLALRIAKPPAALVATITIWLASSLPVYLYVMPFPMPVAALRFGITRGNFPVFNWTNPQLMALAFSSEHGAFLWTPVLLFATLGLAVAIRRQPAFGITLLLSGALFFYLVAAYAGGTTGASYGNPLLIALSPVFVAGLASLVDALAGTRGRLVWAGAASFAALLIAWNLGLMLQWGMGLIPQTGPVDFRNAAINQVTVVPRAAKDFVIRYVNDRRGLVNHIEGGARE